MEDIRKINKPQLSGTKSESVSNSESLNSEKNILKKERKNSKLNLDLLLNP
jgi:hypothetical protein